MKLIKTSIGRLRIIALTEGFSLVLLVFIATPLKYGLDYTRISSLLGSIHGALFLLFLALSEWQLKTTGSLKQQHGKSFWPVLFHSARFTSTEKFSKLRTKRH